MSNKVFLGILSVLILGTVGFTVINKKSKPPEPPRPGIEQADKGQQHVADGSEPYGGPEPPTSGNHSSHIPWQNYDQEVPDMNLIHNLEHGGIYIAYRPDLPAEQVAKIKSLFFRPFSNNEFSPTKAVLAPRAANGSPIIMSSWKRNMKLDSFDEQKMMDFYLRNVGKSPEGTAS